jgi:hypothetical protein
MQSPGFFVLRGDILCLSKIFFAERLLVSFIKNKKVLLVVLLSLLTLFQSLQATVTLNSTAPGGTFTNGYQGATYVPGDHAVTRGHFMLKNGITLPTSNTWTWDGDGIVNGTISLPNTNTTPGLTLATDLRLGSTARFDNVNLRVAGGGNHIVMNCDMVSTGQISLNSDLTIDGQGHTLKVINNSGTSYFIASLNSSTLTLKNMTLLYDACNTENFLFKPSSYILENVTIRAIPYAGKNIVLFSSTSSAPQTTLTIRGRVGIECPGSSVLLSTSNNVGAFSFPITLEKNSTLYVGKNTAFALTAPVGFYSATCSLSMVDATSVLHLDGCDFYTSTNSGSLASLQLTKGTVLLENKVKIFNAIYDRTLFGPAASGNTDITKGLIFGDGTLAGDMNVRMLGSAYVTVDGCMKYNHS